VEHLGSNKDPTDNHISKQNKHFVYNDVTRSPTPDLCGTLYPNPFTTNLFHIAIPKSVYLTGMSYEPTSVVQLVSTSSIISLVMSSSSNFSFTNELLSDYSGSEPTIIKEYVCQVSSKSLENCGP